MKKILLTGATGGLGSAVVAFLSENVPVSQLAVLVRDAEGEKAKAYAAAGIAVRTGDYNDKASLVKAFEGTDVLYFVSSSDIGSRMQQQQYVVEAAVETKVGHIVYTSAGRKNEAADAPLAPVMAAHIATEKRIKASGIPYTILQHNLYAEVVPLFAGNKAQLLATKTVFLPAGNGRTAFVPRTELAEAGAIILTETEKHVNKTYAFNGSENCSFETIAQYIAEAAGENVAYYSPAIPEFEAALTAAGVPAEIIGMMIMFGQGIAAGEFEAGTDDLEKIRGRKSTSMRDFLAAVYN